MAFQYQGGNLMRSAAIKNQQQQSLFDSIARGIANYQMGQNRELRKQQIEMDQAAKANDPKRLGTEYILGELMSRGMTREQAAAELMNAQSGGIDLWTNTRKDSLFDSLGLGSPRGGSTWSPPTKDNITYNRQGDTGYGQGSNPAIKQSYEDIRPAIMDENSIFDQLVGMNVGSGGQVDGAPGVRMENDLDSAYGSAPVVDPMSRRPQYPATAPKPMQIATEKAIGVDANLSEHAGKKGIDLQYTPAELELKNQYEIEKQEALTGLNFDDWLKREKEERKMAKEESLPQEALKIRSSFQEAENMNAIIKDLYDNANIFTAGWVGDKTKGIPGTPAHDLAANLKTIESDAGLSKLVEVKERGGTFGALQEKELELLVSNRAALMQSQTPGQFRENLIKYQTQRNKTMGMMADFYQQKFGELPEGLIEGMDKNIIDPMQEKARSGQVFVNPNTGERIKWEGGQWKTVR